MSKKNILAVVARIPYPLNSGGRIATYDVLTMLSSEYNITLIILDERKDNKIYINHLKHITTDIYFIALNKYLCYFNALKGLLFGKPLQVGYFKSKKTQNIIDKLEKKSDLFLSFVIRTSIYGMNLKIKKYNYAIDSMYLNYKKSINNSTSFFWKLIYKIELPLLYNTELKQIQNFDLTSFVNIDESIFWKKFGNVCNLPHGIDDNIFQINSFDEIYHNCISFIGRMDYQPNIDAVVWFCNNILMHLNHGINFLLIGGYLSKDLENQLKKFKNFKYLGFVDDPNIILRSCICNIATMQTGGGLQTKILLSMALGSIVIATPLSASPIKNSQNMVNIIIEDDPRKIINYINDIFINQEKYLHIKNNARKLVYDHYSNTNIKQKLLSHINKIL